MFFLKKTKKNANRGPISLIFVEGSREIFWAAGTRSAHFSGQKFMNKDIFGEKSSFLDLFFIYVNFASFWVWNEAKDTMPIGK